MKLRLPVSLLSLLLGVGSFAGLQTRADYTFTAGDATNDLGNIMYVGDSITHGVNSGSYRWAMHKILVDNGISYNSQGYTTGCHSGSIGTNSSYGGSLFVNQHSSVSSARAYEIAGRKNTSTRFSKSNIKNWLGQSTQKTDGTTYTGDMWTEVNTFFLMIGTNDTLSDYASSNGTLTGIGYGSNLESATEALLGTRAEDGTWSGTGDMDTIVDAMIQSGTDRGTEVNIIVCTLPCWMDGRSNNNNAADFAAIAQYNEYLKEWGVQKGVTVVDVNRGMLDVSRTDKPGIGVSSMFGSDGLHPSAQGDLIIAGNIAKAMGYAGRTAGQERKAAADFSGVSISAGGFTESLVKESFDSTSNVSVNEEGNLVLGGGADSSLTVSWGEEATLQHGFTVDFDLKVGDGSTDGWNTSDSFQLTVGSDSLYGTISISEAYISWGDTVLWSEDMSVNSETLRVAYVTGNEAEGLSAGYYVWLDDMLIGEALTATEGSGHSGVSISCSGNLTATLGSFSMDGTGSWAPTTNGVSYADQGYHMTPTTYDTKASPKGDITYPTTYTSTVTGQTASGTFNARATSDAASGSGAVISVTVAGGDANRLYANTGTYEGSVYVTVEGGEASDWSAAHGESGNFTGNLGLRFAEQATGGKTVFGVVNAGTVTGNVYLEFSAEDAVFGSFTKNSGQEVSIVGAYSGSIDGVFYVQVNAGTFEQRVAGGVHTGANNYVGATRLYINDGTFKHGIYGGGRVGSIGSSASASALGDAPEPATLVVVTGGVVGDGVWGGGFGDDTINGDTYVEVTGGVISGGVHGGGTGGTINGNTHVVLEGNIPQIASTETISGGGTGGTITGNSTVTLRNVARGNNPSGLDRFAGIISGGSNVKGTKTLVLENVQVSYGEATLQDFDVISLTEETSTSLTSIGGACRLEMGASTVLDLSGATDLGNLATVVMGDGASLTVEISKLTTPAGVVFDISSAADFSLVAAGATLEDIDLTNVVFYKDGVYYEAEATKFDSQAEVVNLVVGKVIPEPSAAVLSLLALAGLAARRRRR